MQTLLHSLQTSLDGMNPLDWAIALILAVSTVTAFLRGFIRSLFSLIGLLAGVVAASLYAPAVARYLLRWLGSAAFARVAAFVLVLAGVCLVAALVGRLVRGACSAVGLGLFDRLAGGVFGFARAALLLAALLLPLSPYLQQFAVARSSVLLPYLLPAAHGISFVVPRDFGAWMPTSDTILDRTLGKRPGEAGHANQKSRGEYE